MNTIFKWFITVSLSLFTMLAMSCSITLAAPASFAATSNGTAQTSNGIVAAEPGQVETNPTNAETTHVQNGNPIYYRGSYHSSSRAPSSRVSESRYSSSRTSTSFGGTGRSIFGSGIGSHMFSFGTGWFLGSMFHPFGGYYGTGLHAFSLFGILIDILVIWIIWRIIRRMFR